MSADELIQEVRSLGGRILIDGHHVQIQAPKGAVSFELATRLREHKQDIIMRESMRRLESRGVNIAIFDTGEMRVVITEPDTIQTINDGGTIYSAQDMYHYVQLEPYERMMLHQFKKRFGGSVEWRI